MQIDIEQGADLPTTESSARSESVRRRIRNKTGTPPGSGGGDSSRSITPTSVRRSRDGSAVGSPAKGLDPEADEPLPSALRRRVENVSPAVPPFPDVNVIQRPGVAREIDVVVESVLVEVDLSEAEIVRQLTVFESLFSSSSAGLGPAGGRDCPDAEERLRRLVAEAAPNSRGLSSTAGGLADNAGLRPTKWIRVK